MRVRSLYLEMLLRDGMLGGVGILREKNLKYTPPENLM